MRVFEWSFFCPCLLFFCLSRSLQAALLHHLPNGYCIHTPYVKMEAEMTFLLLWNVVYEKAESSSTEWPIWTCYFYVKATADSSNSYIRLQKLIWFLWQETGFTLLFRVIRIRPLLTIMSFGSYLKISYFLSQKEHGPIAADLMKSWVCFWVCVCMCAAVPARVSSKWQPSANSNDAVMEVKDMNR